MVPGLKREQVSLEEILNVWIPYRVQAIQTMLWAKGLYDKVGNVAKIEVDVAGERKLEGNLTAIANPMIEVGFIHARALLEFMGLTASNGKLVQVGRRKPTDIAIEHYSISGKQLKMVPPEEACKAFHMPPQIIEYALVSVIETTNKWLAHVTTGEILLRTTSRQMDLASGGIGILLQNNLYAKLGHGEEIIEQRCGRYSCWEGNETINKKNVQE